jgi:phage FluMu protein Com
MPEVICTNCNAILKTTRHMPVGSSMKCPRCQQTFTVESDDEPRSSNCLSIILMTLFVLLSICCAGCGVSTWWFWGNIRSVLEENQIIAKKLDPKAEEKAMVVTADGITQEFLDDFKAAEEKYKDKLIEVTGNLASIKEKRTLMLPGAKKKGKEGELPIPMFVMCTLEDAELSKIPKLQNAKQVKVRGRISHSTERLFVGVTDCKVLEIDGKAAARRERDPAPSLLAFR